MKSTALKPGKGQAVFTGNGKRVTVDYAVINSAALTLRALNHTLRKKLLELIEERGEIKVSDIYKKLKIEQSVASHHLAIMRHAEVVTARRESKCIYYSVNHKRINEITEIAKKLAQEDLG